MSNKSKEEEKKQPKRIKPVIEEVVEDKEESKSTPEVAEEKPVEPSAVEPPQAPLVSAVAENAVESEVNTDVGLEKKKAGSFKTVFVTAIISVVLTTLALGGVYVYLSGQNILKPIKTFTNESTDGPTPSVESTPTPTPTPQDIDVSSYSLQVLNGSGVKGAASSVAATLTTEGFSVDGTGNATAFDTAETVIQAKESVPSGLIDKITKALEDQYKIKMGDTLPDTSDYDVVVTIGNE